MSSRVILLQPEAPAKPGAGAACNGCGVCCAWQPCPIGMLVSRRLRGPCSALRWRPAARRYHCGLLADPQQRWPLGMRWLVRPWHALARRWISAGSGCDSDLEPVSGTGATAG